MHASNCTMAFAQITGSKCDIRWGPDPLSKMWGEDLEGVTHIVTPPLPFPPPPRPLQPHPIPPPPLKVLDNLSRLCSAMHGSNAALGNNRSTSFAELEGSSSGYHPSRNLSAPPGPKKAARSMSHHLHRLHSVTSVVTMLLYTAKG